MADPPKASDHLETTSPPVSSPVLNEELRASVTPKVPIRNFLMHFAGLGFFAGSLAMVGIDEYALAGLLLLLSGVAFCVQISEWKLSTDSHRSVRLLKGLLYPAVVIGLIFFAAVFWKKKSEKPLSNLWTNSVPVPVTISSPAQVPLATPALTATPAAAPTQPPVSTSPSVTGSSSPIVNTPGPVVSKDTSGLSDAPSRSGAPPDWSQIETTARSLYPDRSIDRVEEVADAQCNEGCRKCKVVLLDSDNHAKNEYVIVRYHFAGGKWHLNATKAPRQ